MNNHNFYEEVFRGVSEGIMITDASAVILSTNPAFTTLTGYDEADVVGQKTSILKSGEHDASFYYTMWQELKEKRQWKGKILNRKKNEQTFLEYLSIFSVVDTRGKVMNYIGIFSDVTEQQESKEKIEFLLQYDPLTGLLNRNFFSKHIDQAIDIVKRVGGYTALLIVDLDRFKDINDSFGHEIGDELLINISQRFKDIVRTADSLARLGGDEFAFLLHNIKHPEDAAVVALELIESCVNPWKLSNNVKVQIGLTIGIALTPSHAMDSVTLLQYADAALYEAKVKAKGSFCYYNEEMTENARRRIEYENAMRHGLHHNAFTLHYQPQVNILTDAISSVEALLRWNDPKLGSIPPSVFIPIAEESGLIRELGKWVLMQGCRQAKQWHDDGKEIRVAINVSAKQFDRDHLKTSVLEALYLSKLPPDLLELELTESLFMNDNENVLELLESFRNQGITLSIDDFGTGYSSLSYLKKLPVNILKIDKSFVDGLPSEVEDTQIASSIIALGHIMGFEVLAEGVETQEQLEFLASKGCDVYQGYYKSKPVPPEEIVKLFS
ncbi:MAG: putative bifunctional diguanylate cyclase/phosphodiesterase [Sulfuricurvum sp.]